MEHVSRICGIVLAVAFFLPFVTVGPIGCSGNDLVSKIGQLDDLANFGAELEGMPPSPPTPEQNLNKLLIRLLALMPIMGFVSAIANRNIVHIISGCVPPVLLVVYIFHYGLDIIEPMAVGAWLSLAAGITQLLFAHHTVKPPG